MQSIQARGMWLGLAEAVKVGKSGKTRDLFCKRTVGLVPSSQEGKARGRTKENVQSPG